MIVRPIEDLLRRVQPQPVEVIFVDPIAGIGDEKFARRPRIRAIEIDRFAPLVVVAIGEIGGRE
jgi:hypothetical protein